MNSEGEKRENFVDCNEIRLFSVNITALTKTLYTFTLAFFYFLFPKAKKNIFSYKIWFHNNNEKRKINFISSHGCFYFLHLSLSLNYMNVQNRTKKRHSIKFSTSKEDLFLLLYKNQFDLWAKKEKKRNVKQNEMK